MNSYVCHFQRASLTVTARSTYEAQCKAQARYEEALNKRPGTLATKRHMISVHLAAYADGSRYEHSTASL